MCWLTHADGGLYLATPVDPLLVLLPLLEAARGTWGSSSAAGMFCDVEQILSSLGHPTAALLAPLLAPGSAQSSPLECACEYRAAGGQRYYRLR